MDYNTPGFPVLHYLPEFAQTHVHWVSDAIQPSHPLSPSSPPTLSLFQLQGHLFASGGQSIGTSVSASVLPMNIQGWFPLGLTGLIFLLTKGLPRVFSITAIWKHQTRASLLCIYSLSTKCQLARVYGLVLILEIQTGQIEHYLYLLRCHSGIWRHSLATSHINTRWAAHTGYLGNSVKRKLTASEELGKA